MSAGKKKRGGVIAALVAVVALVIAALVYFLRRPAAAASTADLPADEDERFVAVVWPLAREVYGDDAKADDVTAHAKVEVGTLGHGNVEVGNNLFGITVGNSGHSPSFRGGDLEYGADGVARDRSQQWRGYPGGLVASVRDYKQFVEALYASRSRTTRHEDTPQGPVRYGTSLGTPGAAGLVGQGEPYVRALYNGPVRSNGTIRGYYTLPEDQMAARFNAALAFVKATRRRLGIGGGTWV